jgi:spore germination cell wall hydrolase CwlJ-like protein
VNHTLWTRAAKRALIAMAAVGVTAGAASAGKSANAEAYAQALEQGYSHPPSAPAEGQAPAKPAAAPAKAPAKAPLKRDPEQARAIDCLTAAVYYEARGETPAGQAAVAQVVLNRTRGGGYPKSVCGVVYQRASAKACQFSFVCNGAMRGARERAAWISSRRIAARALAGHVMAAVGRATCFRALARRPGRDDGVKLGHQVFYAAK